MVHPVLMEEILGVHHTGMCPILVPSQSLALGIAGHRNCLMQLGLKVKSIINNVALIIKRLKLGLWFADCPFHTVIIPHSYS